jgi:hypothetical protein
MFGNLNEIYYTVILIIMHEDDYNLMLINENNDIFIKKKSFTM